MRTPSHSIACMPCCFQERIEEQRRVQDYEVPARNGCRILAPCLRHLLWSSPCASMPCPCLQELRECTFQPNVSLIKQAVPEPDGPVIVRGLGRHLELKEMAKKKEEEKAAREEEVFKTQPRVATAGYTVPQPFHLSDNQKVMLWRKHVCSIHFLVEFVLLPPSVLSLTLLAHTFRRRNVPSEQNNEPLPKK